MRVLAFDAVTGAPIPGAFVDRRRARSRPASCRRRPSSGVTEFNGLPGDEGHRHRRREVPPADHVRRRPGRHRHRLPAARPRSRVRARAIPPSTGGRGGTLRRHRRGRARLPGRRRVPARRLDDRARARRKPTERRAAYVFEVASYAERAVPAPAPRARRSRPTPPGGAGYKYRLVVFPGNVTLYVIAGLEDRSETPAALRALRDGRRARRLGARADARARAST